jgi:hypothetical protein
MEDDNRLGRVLDPAELASSSGSRALLRLEVPASWLEEGTDVELISPERLVCGRCEGGGCDGCARSGALRAPPDTSARTLSLSIPEGSGAGIALRLVHPFGDGVAGGIQQLIVEVRPGPRATHDAARSGAPLAPPELETQPRTVLALAGVAIALAALAALALTR